LETVACMVPTPARYAIQMALTACFGTVSDGGRTANMTVADRGAELESQPKPA